MIRVGYIWTTETGKHSFSGLITLLFSFFLFFSFVLLRNCWYLFFLTRNGRTNGRIEYCEHMISRPDSGTLLRRGMDRAFLGLTQSSFGSTMCVCLTPLYSLCSHAPVHFQSQPPHCLFFTMHNTLTPQTHSYIQYDMTNPSSLVLFGSLCLFPSTH